MGPLCFQVHCRCVFGTRDCGPMMQCLWLKSDPSNFCLVFFLALFPLVLSVFSSYPPTIPFSFWSVRAVLRGWKAKNEFCHEHRVPWARYTRASFPLLSMGVMENRPITSPTFLLTMASYENSKSTSAMGNTPQHFHPPTSLSLNSSSHSPLNYLASSTSCTNFPIINTNPSFYIYIFLYYNHLRTIYPQIQCRTSQSSDTKTFGMAVAVDHHSYEEHPLNSTK